MGDGLAPEQVEPLLRGRFGRPYTYLERTPSTQRALAEDAPEGALVVADEQTEGRGRLDRTWVAPAGTSILASLLLRPRIATERLPELTVVAGRAVATSLAEATGLEPTLKFPNDVLVDGRKVAGILAEARDGLVVLGFGININQTEDELPVDTVTPPTSLRLATGERQPRAELLAAVLVELERAYDEWLATA